YAAPISFFSQNRFGFLQRFPTSLYSPALYAQRPHVGPCASFIRDVVLPAQREVASRPLPAVVLVLLCRCVVAVIKEPEPVRDPERVAERCHKRLERIGTHAHHV